MTMFYTEKEIRNTIAYDVGYINSLCNVLGKQELGQQIYNKFMKGV